MEALLKNVIWPAAAGNVAWALITAIVSEQPDEGYGWRLVLLSQFTLYLMLVCVREAPPREKRRLGYLPLDTVFAASLAFSAVATSVENPSQPWVAGVAMAVMLALAGSGHLFKIWEAPEEGKSNKWLMYSEFLGALLILRITFPELRYWSIAVLDPGTVLMVQAITLIVVVAFYLRLRFF